MNAGGGGRLNQRKSINRLHQEYQSAKAPSFVYELSLLPVALGDRRTHHKLSISVLLERLMSLNVDVSSG